MNLYLEFVKSNPILSAAVQFALLGTFGEIISCWMAKGKLYFPFTLRLTFWKMFTWSVLAVCIKYAFVGFNGFTDALIEQGMVPEMNIFGKAFTLSLLMNLQFGLFLVIFHRILDNIYPRKNNWGNISKSLFSLLWFWIPAHTITFMLPKDYQIGLAALWSLVLGLILGYFSRGTVFRESLNAEA